MGLIRKIFWVAVTLVFTFLFTVLFEHGPFDYMKNVDQDLKSVKEYFKKPVPRKADASDKLPTN